MPTRAEPVVDITAYLNEVRTRRDRSRRLGARQRPLCEAWRVRAAWLARDRLAGRVSHYSAPMIERSAWQDGFEAMHLPPPIFCKLDTPQSYGFKQSVQFAKLARCGPSHSIRRRSIGPIPSRRRNLGMTSPPLLTDPSDSLACAERDAGRN